MANKLRTFDFEAPSNITTSEKAATYPWDEWLDGDIWQLEQGDDFETHPLMMERIIRTRATARGAKVRLRHQPGVNGVNGSKRKPDPFGTIVMQRTDIVGPAEQADADKAAARKRAENATKRAERKAAAAKAADEFIASKNLKPRKATKSAVKPSKRPAKRLTSV